MNYKEKYEEALDRAKQGLPIDEVFPELKESEDEKIRKAIGAAICGTTAISILEANGTNLSDALAYLEKQKEQNPAEYIKRNSKEWHSLLAEQWDKGFWKGKAEQQPAEWSEEDEKHFNWIIEHFRQSGELYHDLIDWLKSLRPQLKRRDWTDEDSLAIKEIQNALEIYMINHGISEKQRKKLARWLDIHCNAYPLPAKLYPHLEPSKEQMEALKFFIRSLVESGRISPENPTLCAAKSLLSDLQKLL